MSSEAYEFERRYSVRGADRGKGLVFRIMGYQPGHPFGSYRSAPENSTAEPRGESPQGGSSEGLGSFPPD